MNLEHEVERRLNSINLKEKYKDIVNKYLDALKGYDDEGKDATYNHSMRVGLLSYDVAEYLSFDKKALFLAGLLHDIGKVRVERNVLHNTNFSDLDYKKIMPHPKDGYDMLSGTMEFTAQVIVRHHKHQHNPYPEMLPESKIPFSQETKDKIEKYGLILSMVDFYDSYFRNDGKYFDKITPQTMGKDSIKTAYQIHRGEICSLFYELVDMGVFSERYRRYK